MKNNLIQKLFEAHLNVRHLERAMEFYGDRLGLKLGYKFYNFLNDGTGRPMVHSWMSAVSIYFADPDGHELEFIAPLPDQPKPELGVVAWEEWKAIK